MADFAAAHNQPDKALQILTEVASGGDPDRRRPRCERPKSSCAWENRILALAAADKVLAPRTE
jgi:hypothetical protein